jgi:hypothetical protein
LILALVWQQEVQPRRQFEVASNLGLKLEHVGKRHGLIASVSSAIWLFCSSLCEIVVLRILAFLLELA